MFRSIGQKNIIHYCYMLISSVHLFFYHPIYLQH